MHLYIKVAHLQNPSKIWKSLIQPNLSGRFMENLLINKININ